VQPTGFDLAMLIALSGFVLLLTGYVVRFVLLARRAPHRLSPSRVGWMALLNFKWYMALLVWAQEAGRFPQLRVAEWVALALSVIVGMPLLIFTQRVISSSRDAAGPASGPLPTRNPIR